MRIRFAAVFTLPIGLLFGKRLDTIHPSTRYRIRCGFIFWRADLKISIFAVEFVGCMWTEAVSGKKNLRIQKHPDTCGPDPNYLLKAKSQILFFADLICSSVSRPKALEKDICVLPYSISEKSYRTFSKEETKIWSDRTL